MATTDDPQPAAPIMVAFAGPTKQRRLTVFFRLILVIPNFIVLFFVGLAGVVVTILGWFGALVLGRLPRFAADFLPGVLRWQVRFTAYEFLLTDKYPPFTLDHDDDFPVWLAAEPGRLNRAAVLFRIILVLPALVVSWVVQQGAFTLIAFIAWWIVLISGRMPPSLYLAYAAVIRYQARVGGYSTMITSEWPWGLFGDQDTFGAQSLISGYGVPPAYGGATAGYGATPGYGAAPTYGAAPGGPLPPPPAPAASAVPVVPGVNFTFGGPAYLWGYSDDRSLCGIWSATDPGAPPQTWPIGEQGEAWTRFWELDPQAKALEEPTPPPAAAAPWSSGPPAVGASPPGYPTGPSPYGAGSPYPAADAPDGPTVSALPASGATYPTSGTAADDPRWRLVLGYGAKPLMIVFLVLGVIAGGGNLIVQLGHPFKNLAARVQVEAADAVLTTQVNAFEASTSACKNSSKGLSCFTAADRVMAQAFGTFASTLNGISEPADATAAASRLEVDAVHSEQILASLGASTTQAQYDQIAQSSNLDEVLNQFDQDYSALRQQLG
jgi:Domain of unknown function (DUF4389)